LPALPGPFDQDPETCIQIRTELIKVESTQEIVFDTKARQSLERLRTYKPRPPKISPVTGKPVQRSSFAGRLHAIADNIFMDGSGAGVDEALVVQRIRTKHFQGAGLDEQRYGAVKRGRNDGADEQRYGAVKKELELDDGADLYHALLREGGRETVPPRASEAWRKAQKRMDRAARDLGALEDVAAASLAENRSIERRKSKSTTKDSAVSMGNRFREEGTLRKV
jgi:hypothetical protein